MFDRDNLNFKVEKVNLHNIYDGITSNISRNVGVGLRRKDTGQILSIVKDSYNVIQYNDLIDEVEFSLKKSNLELDDAEYRTILYDDGAKMELQAKFPSHATTIDDKNDKITPQFLFRSSFDRTWANSGMMGYFRHYCYNTLIDGNKLAHVYGRSTKNFNIDAFTNKIKNAANYISTDSLDKMKSWYQIPVQREQALNLFKNTIARRYDNVEKKNVGNKVVMSNLMKIFDNENKHLIGKGSYEHIKHRDEGTLWTTYQAATAWSTNGYTSANAQTSLASLDRKASKAITKSNRETSVMKMLDSEDWKMLESNLVH
tara:strand:+ start:596 stop:1540 length:945 start_codon:yes stop_codon:yes gene_type:complete